MNTPLVESRLYSFLDNKHNFNIHFLEGQKAIHDLVLLHQQQGEGFSFFRNSILTFSMFTVLLKPGEHLGLYIDSDEPSFNFKLELNWAGNFRTLLLPEDFESFPEKIKGNCRLAKTFPGKLRPYTSVLELKGLSLTESANLVLKDSYQIQSMIHVSEDSDQAVLLIKLPPPNVNVISIEEMIPVHKYWDAKKGFLQSLMKEHHSNEAAILKKFEAESLFYLGARDIRFNCPCSRERMVGNILGLPPEELFGHDNEIEIRCDYCKKTYKVTKEEFFQSQKLQ